MNMIIMFLSFFFLVVSAFFLYLGTVRAPRIANHLKNLARNISVLAERDFREGKNYQWRFEELRRVIEEDYDKMVWQFWRSPESFYDRGKLLK